MADVLSVIAILVSVASFAWSLWIESKLDKRASARFAFDAIVISPVEVKLHQFERIFEELSQCALENSESEARSMALQQLIRRRFNPWYFSTDAFLVGSPAIPVEKLLVLLADLPDRILGPINQLSSSSSAPEVDGLAAELVIEGTKFVAAMRFQVHETRLAY